MLAADRLPRHVPAVLHRWARSNPMLCQRQREVCRRGRSPEVALARELRAALSSCTDSSRNHWTGCLSATFGRRVRWRSWRAASDASGRPARNFVECPPVAQRPRRHSGVFPYDTDVHATSSVSQPPMSAEVGGSPTRANGGPPRWWPAGGLGKSPKSREGATTNTPTHRVWRGRMEPFLGPQAGDAWGIPRDVMPMPPGIHTCTCAPGTQGRPTSPTHSCAHIRQGSPSSPCRTGRGFALATSPRRRRMASCPRQCSRRIAFSRVWRVIGSRTTRRSRQRDPRRRLRGPHGRRPLRPGFRPGRGGAWPVGRAAAHRMRVEGLSCQVHPPARPWTRVSR